MNAVLRVLATSCLLVLAGCRGEPDALAREPEPSVEPGPGGFYGSQMPEPWRTPTVRLVGDDGAPFDLAAERGKVVLLFLGYTRCPDVCPTTLSTWKRVRAALGDDTSRVRMVFVSVDPERDSPEDAARYARQFDPGIVGLTGRRSEVDAIQRQFGVTSFAETPPPPADSASAHGGHHAHGGADSASTPATSAANYTVAHASRVFVIDPAGRWRLLLPSDAGVKATVRDVEKLLGE